MNGLLRSRTRLIHLHLLLTAAAFPALGGSGVELLAGSRVAGCGIHLVQPGLPGSSWLTLEGFEPSEWDGVGVGLIGERSSLLLLVDRPRGRRLSIAARAARATELSLSVNGVDSGSRRLARRWKMLDWKAPGLRAGPNRIELTVSGGQRGLAARARAVVAQVGLHPARRCSRRAVEVPLWGSAGSVDLWPGWFVVAQPPPDDSPEVTIHFSGGRKSTLSVHCYSSAGGREVANLSGERSQRLREHLAPASACSSEEKMVLWSRGGAMLSLRSVEASSPDGWTWRHGVRVWAWLSTLVVAAVVSAGAWRGLRLPSSRRRRWYDVALVVGVALVVRAIFVACYPYAGAAADSYEYWLRAGELASGADVLRDPSWHAWQSFSRPPGYFLFLALFLGPLGAGKMAIVWAQIGLSALAAGLVYLMALPNFGRGAALAAGLLFALSMESMATAPRLLAEPLFMFFLLAGLAAVASLSTGPSYRTAILAGVMLGLAALIRAGPVPYAVLVGLALLAIHGVVRGGRLTVALLASLLVIVLPWCVRNSVVHGRPMGIETASVANLLLSSPQNRFVSTDGLDLSKPEERGAYQRRVAHGNRDGRIDRQRGAIVKAILVEKIGHPAATLAGIARGVAALVTPVSDSYLGFILYERDSHRVAWLTGVMRGQFLLIVVLGLGGLALTICDRRVWPLALWPLLNSAAIVLFFELLPRFRFTLLPVVMVFAGALIARLLESASRRRRLRQKV